MEAHSGEKSNHPNGALAMCTDRSFKTKNLDGCIPALVCSPFASSSKLDVLTERTPSILVVVRTACCRIAVLSAKGAECSRGEVTRILGYDKMSAYHGWVNVHLINFSLLDVSRLRSSWCKPSCSGDSCAN